MKKCLVIILFLGFFAASPAPMRHDHILQHQQTFALNVAKLIVYINDNGYRCTLGETYRPTELAQIYAKSGKGILNSNHCYKLAIDVNLFDLDGHYLSEPKYYMQFGIFWEKLNPFNEWGGRWIRRSDSNHFEAD